MMKYWLESEMTRDKERERERDQLQECLLICFAPFTVLNDRANNYRGAKYVAKRGPVTTTTFLPTCPRIRMYALILDSPRAKPQFVRKAQTYENMRCKWFLGL